MTRYGYFLLSEEHGPAELVAQAALAERAGFDALWISDHFHPWIDEQGQSPFVWGVLGAIVQTTSLPITTAVTCPTVRTHPAIVAHAAATIASMSDGRFSLGVGTGENLNEHVHGDRWPPAPIRLERLEEAVEVMRRLWAGDEVSHHGSHYTVENARLYTVPPEPPKVLVSAFGPKALELAARIGDGYVGTAPSPDLVSGYGDAGGQGPRQGGVKICWDPDEETARKTAHRLWPTSGLPGELNQELATPAHFEQAVGIVSEDAVTERISCGPDLDRHVQSIRAYEQAGYDEVYIAQIGADEEFFRFAEEQLLPALRG